MNTVTGVQIQDEIVCISYSIISFRKCMNPTILPMATSKWLDRLGSIAIL